MVKQAPETIGTRIRRFREEKEMSLNALANTTGISKSYLWSLENEASASRPSGATLYEIARALGVTMSALLGRQLLTDPPDDIPPGLSEFAREQQLTEADIRMLANIQFRGDRPQTKERWAYIYNAIRTSKGIDDSGKRPRRGRGR